MVFASVSALTFMHDKP